MTTTTTITTSTPDVPVPGPAALLALADEPLLAAAAARARRDTGRGRTIAVLAAAAASPPELAAIAAAPDQPAVAGPWPTLASLPEGSHVIVRVAPEPAARAAYVAWLHEAATATLPPLSLAACSGAPAGLHQLWCIAAARLVLPSHVSIHARHDLLGIRLAQLALGFGADALSGPIAPERTLPLCGVPRPDETTRTALTTLVRHAGLPVQDTTESES